VLADLEILQKMRDAVDYTLKKLTWQAKLIDRFFIKFIKLQAPTPGSSESQDSNCLSFQAVN
jgi:hypothetical protein